MFGAAQRAVLARAERGEALSDADLRGAEMTGGAVAEFDGAGLGTSARLAR